MAIIMISELPGAGPEFADVARQQGLFDQMKSAPGFMGHWSGATDSGYRVFEVWESPEEIRCCITARGQAPCR